MLIFGSVHVKYKIFLSAIEYLPFSRGVDVNGSFEKGSFEEIIERFLIIFFRFMASFYYWSYFLFAVTSTEFYQDHEN